MPHPTAWTRRNWPGGGATTNEARARRWWVGCCVACCSRGVQPRLQHRATELIVRDGRVMGARATGPDGEVDIHADKGVVLATGGFEWDPELVRAFLRGPLKRSASIPPTPGTGVDGHHRRS